MGFRLTHRDRELLFWINGFGFVTVNQVIQKWKNSRSSAYWRLSKLVHHNYLQHQKIFDSLAGIYRLTAYGQNAIGDGLSYLKRVNLNNYRHDLTVLALSLHLESAHSATFIPERRIRYDLGIASRSAKFHIPDGILKRSHESIAIEVEYSIKSKKRRAQILEYYLKQLDYDAVWYFCHGSYVNRQLQHFSEQFDFLTIYDLADYEKMLRCMKYAIDGVGI